MCSAACRGLLGDSSSSSEEEEDEAAATAIVDTSEVCGALPSC